MQNQIVSDQFHDSEILRRGEKLYPLPDVVQFYPRPRRGKVTHRSTPYRHATTGLRGVILESVQCAGVRASSKEAVFRFFAELTRRAGLVTKSPVTAQDDAVAANERLKQLVFRRIDRRKQSKSEDSK